MFISDILSNPAKVFPRQSEDQRKANLESVKYIHSLSKQSQVNISTWNINELFKDPANKKQSLELIKNRNDINRIFFSEYERRQSDKSIEVSGAVNAIRSQLANASETIKQKRLQQLQREVDYIARDGLPNYLSRIDGYIKQINGYRKQMDALNGLNTTDRIVSDMEEVLASGFFQFFDLNDSRLRLTTTNDIVMTQKNPLANLDITVNLGKFYVTLSFEDTKLEVTPMENNVFFNGMYHPYVSSNGRVCFGDGEPMAVDYRMKMNLKGLFTLLQAILTTYSDSTPYARLTDLHHASLTRTNNTTLPHDNDR